MTKAAVRHALLAACAAAALASAAQAAGTLRLDEVAVGELDPAKASDYADSLLMFNVYDTLVLPKQGAPGQQPHLAREWSVDETGTAYTFALRDDVRFESGNPLTSADVVYSFDRMKAIGQGLSYLFEGVTGAEAVDAHTVRFTLAEPSAPFLASLVRLPIVDSVLVREKTVPGEGPNGDWGQGFLSGDSAGSAAYLVDSHNPQSETLMQRNPAYFLGVPPAAPDTVRLRYGLEAATVRTLISTGEHDISSQWLPPEVLRALADGGAQLLSEQSQGGFYIKMNTAKPPLDDVHCRKALALAFDYATALKIVAINAEVSQGAPANGAIPPSMLGSLGDAPPLARDLDAARAELAQCRHAPADINLQLSWIAEVPVEERFALLMQANFAELGLKSQITKVPWALFTEQVTKPETTPDVSQLFVNAVTGDTDTLLWGMYHSSARGTWQAAEHLASPEVDAKLLEGRTTTDETRRAEVYRSLNRDLLAIAPTIYGYFPRNVVAASKRVKAPALSDPAQAFGVDGMNFLFRLMELSDG